MRRLSTGVLVITYESPDYLDDCLQALLGCRSVIDKIVVVDNSATPSLDVGEWTSAWDSLTYVWDGGNRGLPAAIGIGFEHLTEFDGVLVLDDDTLMDLVSLTRLQDAHAILGGIVAVPFELDRATVGSNTPDVFAWSPAIIGREVRSSLALPRSEFFFGWDDWEYGIRARRHGFLISWIEVRLARRQAPSAWAGREYLAARNIAYLMLYCQGWRSRSIRRQWRFYLGQAVPSRSRSASTGMTRSGLIDGARRKMGRPPERIMADRTRAALRGGEKPR